MNYPQSISEEESELGFQRLEVDGLAEFFHAFRSATVVAKILSPSEILAKTDAGYSHLIFGRTPIPAANQNLIWQDTFEEIKDARQFLHAYEVGLMPEGHIPLMERREFTYREISN